MKKRTIALMMAVVMLFGVAIGGTIAWLTSKTDPVVNTFTVGDVSIELEETGTTTVDNVDTKSYQLIPGTIHSKDPVVSVVRSETNVDCWLFVKFEEINNPSDYLTYTSTLTTANNWTQGDGTKIPRNVWYRKVLKTDTTISWNLLAGNSVTVKNTVVKTGTAIPADSDLVEMPAADSEPQLKWTAYAAQSDNLSAEDAWDLF